MEPDILERIEHTVQLGRREGNMEPDILEPIEHTVQLARREGNMETDILERIFDGSIQSKDVKLSALESITENFSKERIIGEGGFGIVYKGILRNGEVAVKRIRNNQTIDEKLFRREVSSLLKANHKNIVRFLGFCSHTEHKAIEYEGSGEFVYAENRERLLCFEYINNGSLEKYIADELRGLPWDTRYSIIKGICEGLQYLHMKRRFIHMDLKPANILIDDSMVAKITDFGLARMVENSETKSTVRFSSPGYSAPEYIDQGIMTVKYDVYSLGVIIIELLTGHRSTPDSNNVLRRWRHRWHRSGKKTPFRYEQIAKLVEIGLQCQEKDPYKRPFISDIISVINKLESTDRQFGNANELMISPYPEDDMLGIEPLELRFPIKLDSQISCSLELTNETNDFFAFNIQTTSPLPFCIQPNKDIVAPRSKYSVNITLQPLDHAPQDGQCDGDFIVRSTKVNGSLLGEDITTDMFNNEEGKLVDEVNLTITYKDEVPQVDVSLGSQIIPDMRNSHSPQESNISPTQVESKISASTSDEVILFDPPELCFPLVPDKKVLSSVKIINITEAYVSFILSYPDENTANYSDISRILPPRSTQWLTISRKEKKDVVTDMQCNDRVSVWYAIVAEDIKASDLDWEDYNEWKDIPVVLTNASPCTSNELIQFDPAELSLPFIPNKDLVFSVNVVNDTDCCVGFYVRQQKGNVGWYDTNPADGVMPPRTTQKLVVKWKPKNEQPKERFLLWSSIVSEGVNASDFEHYIDDEGSKELPIVYKTSLCNSDELIQFDSPQLPFHLLPNTRVSMLCLFKIINVTDHSVGFNIWSGNGNFASYLIKPQAGILPAQSTRAIKVIRTLKEQETQDMRCKDEIFVWNGIVTEGVEVSDVNKYQTKEDKELPVVLTTRPSSTLVELIKFEPPEICFPFLPSKRMLSSFKIVNITKFHIGFNTHAKKTNVALYITEPPCGVLAPWSTQELVVTRVAKAEAPELEDMQCKDKYFVWSCLVTKDVNATDLRSYMSETQRKELPIVFTETSSNEYIQFDPPELRLLLLQNQKVMSSAKIVNITDQYIGFRIHAKKSNSARYYANPSEGILPPLSTQVLLVTSVAHEKESDDTQCEDKFLVWNGIVTEDVQASNVIDNMSRTKSTEFPIVLKKTGSSTSDELIQFDPPELHFPFLPNKKVLSSFNMVNLTNYNVCFNTYSRPTNAAWYHTDPPRGILQPRSTQKIMVTREEKEDALLKDKELNDKYFVWKSIVTKGVKQSDFSDCMVDQESKELPIVLDKINASTSDELIQVDPTEFCIPILMNKLMLVKVDVVNTTDFYVAFHLYTMKRREPRYKTSMETGILPPRSTKKVIAAWISAPPKKRKKARVSARNKRESCMKFGSDYFVWSRVVTKTVESGDIISYMDEEESKHLPYSIPNMINPCTSTELIQFDPPELSVPFRPNKPVVFSVNVVNLTDYYVGFRLFDPVLNVGWYYIEPDGGVIPPRSTQRLVVKRIIPKDKEPDPEDMQCQDKVYLWNNFVGEGVEASDIVDYLDYKDCKQLPIVYKKSSLSVSDELIQLDPPQLPFPFLPNKRVAMFYFFKIVNVTDHIVGFSISSNEGNSAEYGTEPDVGILPPQSTQVIKVRRILKEKNTEDMQCKDKILVWNGIVNERVKSSDIREYWKEGDKELPIVLTKPGESSAM